MNDFQKLFFAYGTNVNLRAPDDVGQNFALR